MELVRLRLDHQTALREFLDEFAHAGEPETPAFLVDRNLPHARIVELLDAWSRGEQLEEDWVPSTTWFLAEAGRLLGVANLRHRLTPSLRRFGGHVGYSVRPSERGNGYATLLLEEVKRRAQDMGLSRLLVTCAPANEASARVIAKCGGRYEDVSFYAPAGHSVCRYWISLE